MKTKSRIMLENVLIGILYVAIVGGLVWLFAEGI